MMKRLMLLGVGAVGYVMGAKAGRERYEQIAHQAQKLRSNPTVQQKVEEAKGVAKEAASTATAKVRKDSGNDTGGGTETTSSDDPLRTTTSPDLPHMTAASSDLPPPTPASGGGSGFGQGDENA